MSFKSVAKHLTDQKYLISKYHSVALNITVSNTEHTHKHIEPSKPKSKNNTKK